MSQYPPDQPQQQSYPYPPQQQPYPPGQYAPPPYGAPSSPPPRKKRRIWLWIVVALVVLAVIGAVAANSGGKGATPTASTTPTTSGSSSSSTPTAPAGPTAHKVGDVVSIGSWQVTVNGVSTNTGDSVIQPKAGNVFVLIDVTVTNTDSQAQPVSSLISFDVKDASGQKYTETIVDGAPNPPDGNVPAGGKVRGTLAYEMPTSAKSIELDFTPSLGSTDVATWNLTVP